MRQLYFVRHGQTHWNAMARMQGQQNSDLNELGQRQADVHGRLLRDLGVAALYASPLDRTRQTTAIIQRHLPLQATFEPRIMEWDCGDWSGHLYADVRQRWAAEWAAWEADRFHYRPPGCENFPDMIARVTPFIKELLLDPANTIAVVSHGMIGRVMIGIVMDFNEQQMLTLTQPNDVVYRVRVPEREGVPRMLDHYRAGRGPCAGIVQRQAR